VPQPGGGLRRMAPPSMWPTCRTANSGTQ
jgi:hypothetical protein